MGNGNVSLLDHDELSGEEFKGEDDVRDEDQSLVPSEVESLIMRRFAKWTAEAQWCPSPWQQDADAGDKTLFVVIFRSRASSTARRLHVKMTRREEGATVQQPYFKWLSSSSSEEPKLKKVCLPDGDPRGREEEMIEYEIEEEVDTRELGRALGWEQGRKTAAQRVGTKRIFQTVVPYLDLDEQSNVEYLSAFLESYYYHRQEMEKWGQKFNDQA